MTLPKKMALLTVLMAAGIMSFGAVALSTQDHTPVSSADPNNPPPKPAWVRADGTVDPNKMPECVKVLGQDGLPVKKNNGKPVCISSEKIMRPPSGPPPENPRAVNARNRAMEKGQRIAELPRSSPANKVATNSDRD